MISPALCYLTINRVILFPLVHLFVIPKMFCLHWGFWVGYRCDIALVGLATRT
ncbi:MAG: hypothetical protein K9I70_04845 [Chitinophagaceae bacterium]|nr:hypothetical protein [Chitinophagaceae bacterium]